MKTQNEIIREIVAETGLTRYKAKRKYAYDLIVYANNIIMLDLLKSQGNKEALKQYAFAEHRNATLAGDKIKRSIREYASKLYFRAYKAA